MTRYPPLVAALLLWLSTLTGLSVSQSTWTLDPQKHLALMYDHMSVMVNSTIYTIGGVAVYWTPNSTASSVASDNDGSSYIIKTANSFLRALDLSKPLDPESESTDTSEVISELPLEIPHVKRGAVWADNNTIYYWGGELAPESIYMRRAFQNFTRKWPDPMMYYAYDLSQPKGSGTWKTLLISRDEGSDTLTSSPSYGDSTYAPEARKGFYFGGVVARRELKNKDESNATMGDTSDPYYVNSMVVFDSVMKVWKNETIISELNNLQDGVMVYVPGVGEKGLLVRMGGTHDKGFVSFGAVYVYDIAAKSWHRQSTTSLTHNFPEPRFGGFCAGAVAAPDKTSFTIYIYGGQGHDSSYLNGTWALTMPYFQWLPVGSTGEPERGRTKTTCHAIGSQLAMIRGDGDQENSKTRGDTNGGSYFYDMTNLRWSLNYQPSEYRVPKVIYDVIGGNGEGRANITSPENDKVFAAGLGKLFDTAAGRTTPESTSPRSNPTGAIVGGVIGGIVLLAAIGAGIWVLLRLRRRSADTVGRERTMNGRQENSFMAMVENSPATNHEGGSSYRFEVPRVLVPHHVHELDSAEVYEAENK